jgi:hypothetical protein
MIFTAPFKWFPYQQTFTDSAQSRKRIRKKMRLLISAHYTDLDHSAAIYMSGQ